MQGLRDPFSSLSHLFGFLVSFYVLVIFWRLSRDDLWRRVALLAFGLSLTLLFGASGTYHGLTLSAAGQRICQLIDQTAIYILIAGTYTPTLYLLLVNGPVKVIALTSIWAMAIAGIVCKWAFLEQPYWLVVAPYIALGWVGVLIYRRLHLAVGIHGMKWVVLGGIAYSVGAVIDWQMWPDLYSPIFGPHELFHVLVLVGASCHIYFIIEYAATHQHMPPGTI